MTAALSTQALWYLTRGSGIVTLLLLSAVVVLGLLTARRTESERWPRFAVAELHRQLALCSVAFLAVHVATAVSDPFAPIGWVSAIVPFSSSYRPLWLGLGTLAVDLLVAILATSLLRHRLNERLWRAVHWLAYLSWPVALFHSLGTGSDVRQGWFLLVVALCVLAVFGAFVARLGFRWPERAGARLAGAGAAVAVIVIGAAFTALGPLRPGWAQRAGTPSAQLGATAALARGAASAAAGGGASLSSALAAPPYRASFVGSVVTTGSSDGREQIAIRATTSGAVRARLAVDLVGRPDGSGGVYVASTRVTYGPATAPTLYSGTAVAVNGSRLTLVVRDGAGSSLTLALRLDLSGTALHGTLQATSGAIAAAGTSGAGGDDGGRGDGGGGDGGA